MLLQVIFYPEILLIPIIQCFIPLCDQKSSPSFKYDFWLLTMTACCLILLILVTLDCPALKGYFFLVLHTRRTVLYLQIKSEDVLIQSTYYCLSLKEMIQNGKTGEILHIAFCSNRKKQLRNRVINSYQFGNGYKTISKALGLQ